ncbi:ABC transporter permease [Mariprofundus sp. EBB-1]|uniref:ABC transporter permease n=1 Tax=Mariprofundus sp. EBB-1 TaxID=2650971 RepID=UPI000EF1DAB6|nr:ABC transporter permease [Mariprofundus sp. EBB-1]RLL49164.1 ABC transporter permease [Mariprofundus sp. EBB-1]
MMNFRNAVDVILYRAYSEMRAEVVNGSMGMLLWVVEPLLYLGAFYIVFSALGLRGGTDAVPFLLIGLVVWKWFASSVYRGASSIKSAAAVMQQIHVPKYVFLISALLSVFYQFLIVFGVLLGFLLLYGIEPGWGWINLVVIVFIQLLLTVGIAGIFAVFLPFFPDLQVIVSNGLTMMFFMSGIFFEIDSVSEFYQRIFYLNPMATMIEAYRDVFLTGQIGDWSSLGIVALISVILIVMVVLLLHKWDRVYPKVLPV